MNAKTIIARLIEANQTPNRFSGRENSRTTRNAPTRRYHFNVGEGNYRCGIAFDVYAVSRGNAVVLANQFLRTYFYSNHQGGSLDLPTARNEVAGAGNLRVYIDDDVLLTEHDIVTEDPVDEPL